MKLTLIRHGITEGNLRRLYYGKSDLPLDPAGVDALRELMKTHRYPTAAHYCTSGMRRTEQTFALIYGDLPHAQVPGLQELNFGYFEMKSYEDLKDDPLYQTWLTGDVEQNVCPDGESAVLFSERVKAAILPLLEADIDTVCVTHGGVISTLMLHWFAGSSIYEWMPEPAHGYQIEFDHGTPCAWCSIPDPLEK